jgi:hypothetical protein
MSLLSVRLTGRRVSRSPQGRRFHPLVRPPQAVATSVAHLPTRSHDRLRSGERSVERRAALERPFQLKLDSIVLARTIAEITTSVGSSS